MTEEQKIEIGNENLKGAWDQIQKETRESLLNLCKADRFDAFVQAVSGLNGIYTNLGGLLYGYAEKILEEHKLAEQKEADARKLDEQKEADAANLETLWTNFQGDQQTTLKTLAAAADKDSFFDAIKNMNLTYDNRSLAYRMYGYVLNLVKEQEKSSSSFLEKFPYNLLFEKEKKRNVFKTQ